MMGKDRKRRSRSRSRSRSFEREREGRNDHRDVKRINRSHSRSRSRSRSKSPYDKKDQRTTNKSNYSKITSSSGIQMKLMSTVPPASKPLATKPAGPIKKLSVAAVFNDDDDDEPEEMPAECRMRMKNVGRETPTSAGPNSFGKTKIGFCNVTHITEKKHNL